MKKYDVDVDKLDKVFDTRTTTYKFYWMLALLDIVKDGRAYQTITFNEMVAKMLGKAWRPLTSGMYTFGKWDVMINHIYTLIHHSELKDNDFEERVAKYITSNPNDKDVADIVKKMTNYVPYRFLYPWIGVMSNAKSAEASQNYEKYRCPYSIVNETIQINPSWVEYLSDHHQILEDATRYRLTQYLILYNDNIVLPEDESFVTTADGYVVSQNSTMGFATEPMPNIREQALQKELRARTSELNRTKKMLEKFIIGFGDSVIINHGIYASSVNNLQQNISSEGDVKIAGNAEIDNYYEHNNK